MLATNNPILCVVYRLEIEGKSTWFLFALWKVCGSSRFNLYSSLLYYPGDIADTSTRAHTHTHIHTCNHAHTHTSTRAHIHTNLWTSTVTHSRPKHQRITRAHWKNATAKIAKASPPTTSFGPWSRVRNWTITPTLWETSRKNTAPSKPLHACLNAKVMHPHIQVCVLLYICINVFVYMYVYIHTNIYTYTYTYI